MGTMKASVVLEHKRSFFQALTISFVRNVHLEFRPQPSTMQEIQFDLTDASHPPAPPPHPEKQYIHLKKKNSNLPDNEK